MASQKQINKWMEQAEKINNNPEYIQAYVKYKQLAKKADQRLVRLEALQYEEHFKGVLKMSYKRAIYDIQKHWGGDKRFNTAPPTTLTKLQYKIEDIEDFISKVTSKKSSIIKVYGKMAKTINERYGQEYGVEFTWEELANFYESDQSKRDDIKKASKTVVRALAVMKKLNSSEVKAKLQEIKDVNERVQLVSDDLVVNNMVNRLHELGISWDDLKE